MLFRKRRAPKDKPTTPDLKVELLTESYYELGWRTGYNAGLRDATTVAPDLYCITREDGECVSTDPRCMHQSEWRAKRAPKPEAPEVKCGTCGSVNLVPIA